MTAAPLTRRWVTELPVLRRIAFALRVAHPPLFGKTCPRAGPDDPVVDLQMPPRGEARPGDRCELVPLRFRSRCPAGSKPYKRKLGTQWVMVDETRGETPAKGGTDPSLDIRCRCRRF
jgi:hypothetical protein